jgi:sialate O-acetylesterase
MGKSVWTALVAAFVLASCQAIPQQVAAPPTVAVPVKEEHAFPPRPPALLYTTFQDHAVLQRDKPIPVWGLASPSAEVDVAFAGKSAHATADASGNWHTELSPMSAGGPFELAVTSSTGQTQTVKDVMVGDVYLCSGQSNMEMPLRLATNYDYEIQSAKNTSIRLFHVQRFPSPTPHETFGTDASWAVTSPDTVKEFSAVCYYFGREVQPAAGVAIGLIEDAWGGSAIQAWISRKGLHALGGYEEPLEILDTYARDPKAAEVKWRAMAHAWWMSHDPALAASPRWSDPSYDDSGWDKAVPVGKFSTWKVPALKTFDGIVWVRKSFDVTAAQAGGAATISLGAISRTDTTWVNGVDVGAFDGYDIKRVYEIPAGTLREGKNLVAVGVLAGDGLLSPAEEMTVRFADGSVTALTGPWRYKLSAPFVQTGRTPHVPWLNQNGVSVLHNGMIAPLGGTQIRGVLWYQGEADTWQSKEYERLLPALIADWRAKFGADTPFFIAQLTSFGPTATKPQRSDWAALRDVQRRIVEKTPNTALAVTIDLGARDNIHPAAKQELGRRLALLAERSIYGLNIVDRGPTPVAATREGKTVFVKFDNVAAGLSAYEWDRVIGFSLCDAAGNCSFADGAVQHDQIKIDSAAKAATVRYCWADSPLCNLTNSEGLPAGTFEIPISTGKKLIRTPRYRDFRKGKSAR